MKSLYEGMEAYFSAEVNLLIYSNVPNKNLDFVLPNQYFDR